MKPYRIAVLNLGSTSTKVAYYENEVCMTKESISHSAASLRGFPDVWAQVTMRKAAVDDFFQRSGILVSDLDAITTRGGHTRSLPGGTYHINQLMLEQSRSEQHGVHACDLGLILAKEYSAFGPLPLTTDPPVTDEFQPVARYSGLPQITRRCRMHALNQRAVARKYAAQRNLHYEDLNLIVVHMGGGISVAAHKKGKLIDGNDAILGEGPFSSNRTGSLPAGALIDLCYSGAYTHKEMIETVNGRGGLVAYINDNDLLSAEKRAAAGETAVGNVIDAMAYQTAKEIGSCACVLDGDVEAIIITGGMANSKRITSYIQEKAGFIAPITLYPGEFELEALALNALAALRGDILIEEFN